MDEELREGTTPFATHDGFTDSKGRTMTYEEGLRAAARCIVNQSEQAYVEELLRFGASPDEVLPWLVYPDTGEFADPPFRLRTALGED
jgi:hypothetical protein